MRGSGQDGPREDSYVLITQCLQNDFFFNRNCRLGLPADAAARLLIPPASELSFGENRSRRTLDPATIRSGPLGRLLRATVGQRLAGHGRGTLHLINIRDWHQDSSDYDRERRAYGPHCEAGTWGADYLTGLAALLDPAGTRRRAIDPGETDCPAGPDGNRLGSVTVHHVYSDTVFDLGHQASGERSELAEVLSRIITSANRDTVPIAVIGVHTDIKVQILLQELRSAYNPGRLVVSDALTASPTLDRHLAALDYAQKALSVEIMPGVADLARFLGGDPGEDEELESYASAGALADYAQYIRDKQRIESYEDAHLRSYRQQVSGHLRYTVWLATLANSFLIGTGVVTLGSSVVLAVLACLHTGRLPVALPAELLGASVVQLASALFSRPVRELTGLIGQEAVFRMLLESRSLRLALARYHLTTRAALHGEGGAADHAAVVRDQLTLLSELDNADFDWLARFGDVGILPLRRQDGPGLLARGRYPAR
jgi:hypothetical protein